MIIAPSDYRDEELEHPREVFKNAGYNVVIASKGVESSNGMQGGTAEVDINISEVKVEEYEAVIFVGGSGAGVYFDDPSAHKIAKAALDSGKVLGAICIAPSILANAGLLEGKKASSFPSEQQNLEENGAEFTGEAVTVDGRIVTASGPLSAKGFGEEIVKLLK